MKTRHPNRLPFSFHLACISDLAMNAGFFSITGLLALYFVDPVSMHGLGFTQNQKALYQTLSGAIISILPLFSGSLADTFGYRKIGLWGILFAFCGVFTLRFCNSIEESILGIMLISVGMGIYGPIMISYANYISTPKNNYIALSLFWTLRNLGGLIGIAFAAHYAQISWLKLFEFSIYFSGINLLIIYFFFIPPSIKKEKLSIKKNISKAWRNTIQTFNNGIYLRFLIFIALIKLYYLQFYDSVLNYVNQWVDGSITYKYIHAVSHAIAQFTGSGTQHVNSAIYPEIDGIIIVCFQLIVSYKIRSLKVMKMLYAGGLICGLGVILSFLTSNPLYTILAAIIFSFGDLIFIPKVIEFMKTLAGSARSGAFVGAYFLISGVINLFAGVISGPIFSNLGDKYHFMLIEAKERGITLPEIGSGHSGKKAFTEFAEKLNMSPEEATQLLWDKYDPWKMSFIIIALIAIAFGYGIYFYKYTQKTKIQTVK